VKVYLGWGVFSELCEYLMADIELAIEKETGEKVNLVLDYSDRILLGEFPDEHLYSLKRVAAHIHFKGEPPETSPAEADDIEDEELITYIDTYKTDYHFGSFVFFSETVGVYLPLKGLKEPLHFEHEDRKIEICSVGSLYKLKDELLELKEKLKEKPLFVELEILNKLLSWSEEAIKREKPLTIVGE